MILPLMGSFRGVFVFWSLPALLAAVLWWWRVKDPPCRLPGYNLSAIYPSKLLAILRMRNLWLIALIFFLHNYFFYTWNGWMPAYLVERGLSQGAAGLIVSVTLVAGIPGVIAVPYVSARRKVPGRTLVIATGVLMAAAAGAALFIDSVNSWLIMIAVGLGSTLRFLILVTMPAEVVGGQKAGLATGLVTSLGYTGAIAGPLAAGVFLDATGSFTLILILLAATSLGIAALALPLQATGEMGRPPGPPAAM
jgi:CP family cyanate transporter-like MFS transporter